VLVVRINHATGYRYEISIPSHDELRGVPVGMQSGTLIVGMMEMEALVTQMSWHPLGLSVWRPTLIVCMDVPTSLTLSEQNQKYGTIIAIVLGPVCHLA